MYGIGMALQFDLSILKILSVAAKTKPLKDPANLKDKIPWQKYELFSFNSLILIGVLRKYLRAKKVSETRGFTNHMIDDRG